MNRLIDNEDNYYLLPHFNDSSSCECLNFLLNWGLLLQSLVK